MCLTSTQTAKASLFKELKMSCENSDKDEKCELYQNVIDGKVELDHDLSCDALGYCYTQNYQEPSDYCYSFITCINVDN